MRALSMKKGFKGTVVNRALPSLHGGSLEITLTVPLSLKPNDNWIYFATYKTLND